jgi:hypothetical protein
VWLWRNLNDGWTAAKLERLIESEIPPGCSREQVEGWLDRHAIPHGYFGGTAKDAEFNAYLARQAGVDGANLSGVVQGDIADANEHLLRHPTGFLFLCSEIYLYFFFDKQGRLVGHWVDVAVYGP